MAFDLPAWKGLGEDVGRHIVRRAVHDVDSGAHDDLADEMIAYIDVFGPCVVVVVCRELERRLVIAMESGLFDQ